MLREYNDTLVLCINGGVSGQDSRGLLKTYRDEWIKCEPDLVVINLAHNDNLPETFSENLASFIEINQELGIKTLFVTEPLSTEKYPSEKETHQVMRHVAAANDVPLIEMHDYLKELYDSGFLWWDHVHPTPFGHRLIAERLYPAVLRLVSSESKD
jgi:lysophospholipase L1-like esterase